MSESKRKPPIPARPPKANYSVNQAKQAAGKTVGSLKIGFRKDHPKLHQSEMIVLHFTDGTTLAIDTGSNVGNVISSTLKTPANSRRFQPQLVPKRGTNQILAQETGLTLSTNADLSDSPNYIAG